MHILSAHHIDCTMLAPLDDVFNIQAYRGYIIYITSTLMLQHDSLGLLSAATQCIDDMSFQISHSYLFSPGKGSKFIVYM